MENAASIPRHSRPGSLLDSDEADLTLPGVSDSTAANAHSPLLAEVHVFVGGQLVSKGLEERPRRGVVLEPADATGSAPRPLTATTRE